MTEVQEDIPAEVQEQAEGQAEAADSKAVKKEIRFAGSTTAVDEEEAEMEEQEEEEEVLELSSKDDNEIEAMGEEENEKDIDDISLDSDESEDDKFAEVAPPIKRPKMKKERDFFDILGKIPNVDEISITESMAREIAIERGELIVMDTIEEEVEEEEQPAAEQAADIEEAEEEEEPSTEYSEFEFDFASEEEAPEAALLAQISDDNLFEALVKLEEVPVVVIEEPDFELLARLEELRHIARDTKGFLHAIIEAVVEAAEYVDPREVLRENLSKTKVFRKLVSLLEEMHIESKINDFVSGKCVHYYRRQKLKRPITPESVEALPHEMKKFNEAIDVLDKLLGRQSATKNVITNRVYVVEQEAAEMEKKYKNELNELETFIRKTFSKRGSESLNFFVDRRLREMAALRQEISGIRNILIQRQHTKGTLLEKMANLENITETLRLRDYETMLNEEYALIKKIEEKNERLERIRHSFNCHTNIVAHMREKQSMLYYTVQAQTEGLNEAELEKRNLRAYIHKLKTSRIRVQKQIREKSFEGGLIDKPALLLDFDETLERGEELKSKVDDMKSEIGRLEKRLISLEKRIKSK